MDSELALWTTIQDDILSPSSSISPKLVRHLTLWYLHVKTSFSIQSIKEFTTFHFANMESFDENGNIYAFQYNNWLLTPMEYRLLQFYAKKIRSGQDINSSRVVFVNGMHQLTESFFDRCEDGAFTVLQQIPAKQVCFNRLFILEHIHIFHILAQNHKHMFMHACKSEHHILYACSTNGILQSHKAPHA